MLPRAAPPAPPPWRWGALGGAPFRLLFGLGSVAWLLAALWWWWALGAAWPAGASWRPAAGVLHALLMGLSFLPAFVAGFLFTVGPRWLQLAPPAPLAWWPGALAWALGWAWVLAGATGAPLALAPGLALAGLGLGSWVLAHGRACRRSRAPDRLHAVALGGALAVMATALAAAALAAAAASEPGLRAAALVGWWAGVLACFSVALHRMTALLHGLLWPVLAGLALRAAWAAAQALGGPPPSVITWAAGGVMATLACALAWAAVDRHRRPARHNRVTAWLQVAFAWWAVGMALDAAGLLLAAPAVLLAAQHVLALGLAGTVWLTMVGRVCAGQLGQARAIDAALRHLLFGLQAVLLLRLLAACWPQQPWLMRAAAAAFAVAALRWCVHLLPALGRAAPPKVHGPAADVG